MKKHLIITTLMFALLVMPAVTNAVTIQKIQLTQLLGASANFNAATETITWSCGGGGWMMLDNSDVIYFDGSNASASFTILNDTSSGGWASADFSVSSWTLTLTDNTYGDVVIISGGLYGSNKYYEEEISTNHLDGRAIVGVTSASYNIDWFESLYPEDTLQWEGDAAAGLIADVTLPAEPDMADYQSDYASSNLIITLWADESVVPEPATICLLGLGAMVLIRKRRA